MIDSQLKNDDKEYNIDPKAYEKYDQLNRMRL